MGEDGVVGGQWTRPVKVARAKELRRQMTPAEAALWHWLRTNRLYGLHFRRQQVIYGFIADFYCHAARLVVEVDGGVHADEEEYDTARDECFRAHGYTVMRVSNAEVTAGLPGVLARIATACGVRAPA